MIFSIHATAYTALRVQLTDARVSRGVTQAELADRLGCPQSTVSKVERGERRLAVPEFLAWTAALGVDAHAFIDDYLATVRRTAVIGNALSGAKRPRPRKSSR